MTLSNETTLFTRMFPEAKLSVVNALKQSGEVVAMLGDGVNDAPALKAAHIGVAMGNKGTEIAKAAAALVITNDDLDKLIIGIEAEEFIPISKKPFSILFPFIFLSY
jgi:Ca2+-transporting ATPase